MRLHVDIAGWLGLAVALRLQQAAPTLQLSVAVENDTPPRPISGAARAWLQRAFPELKTLLAEASRLPLVVIRDGVRVECGESDLVPVARHLIDFLRHNARNADIAPAASPPAGALIAGPGEAGLAVAPTVAGSSSVQLVFAGDSPAHLRLYPGRIELLWPHGAQPDATALLRQAGLGAVAFTLAKAAPCDFDLGLADDALCLGAAEQQPALIEALAMALASEDAKASFAEQRQKIVTAAQHGVRNRLDWFATPQRHAGLPLPRFAYSLLTASQRTGHEDMAQTYPALVAEVEAAIARDAGLNETAPPMFTPFRLRDMTIANRVVLSPMCMYSATDGLVNDFHLVHLGARAMGGAGLILSEMTAVSAEGRITPGCAGLYDDAHVDAWRRIVAFVHTASPARIGIQLGHAGPKASTQLGWQRMDEPLPEGNWPILAASDIAYGPRNQTPQEMTAADIDMLEGQYVAAASRALLCGFDMIELHFAHGYLLSSFISPLTNKRGDEFGGDIKRRARLPGRILQAVRKIWDKPLSVRISATDWADGGLTGEEAVELARILKAAGADALTVSTGQTTRASRPLYGRMFQVPYSDRIRNEVGISTIAVGAITESDQVNSIVAAGRADLCALARPHLTDASWTLKAAVEQGFAKQWWPKQYLAGKAQAERESGKKPPVRHMTRGAA
ncbi:MAG: NADH:flavin oxidoreductase/NADH oxidase [Alphaproteobacteria bacterium]|nr:NADH:flavin oxidoreductase/NADH oxidase [Alphaproteobacteria bacterium]